MATVGQLVLVREGDAIHPAWVMKVIAGREVVVKYAGWSAAYSETKKFTDIVVPPNARRKTAAASMVEAIEAKKKIMPEGLGTEGIEVTHVRLVDRAGVLSVGEVCDIAYDFPAAVLENAGTDVASSLRCRLDLETLWDRINDRWGSALFGGFPAGTSALATASVTDGYWATGTCTTQVLAPVCHRCGTAFAETERRFASNSG